MADAKLRAVYDALDARNPRQAIKHCNALLAKAPYPLVKALKALALERTGKHDEAAALAREVAESQTTDEVTLSTLAMVLRVQGRAEEATAAYASAVQRRPDSEELATQLFCCHMRARAYAPAQLLALRMYKGFPSPDAPLYLSWAVAALLLQADLLAPLVQEGGLAGTARTVEPAPVAAGGGEGTREADSEGNRRGDEEVKRRADGAQRTKLLQLAVAMMGREEVRNEGDLQLRLAALRRLGDTAAALSLVEQHGALFCTPIERMRARAHLLEGGGRWAEAKEAHREALISHAADDWAAWMGVVRAAIREGRAEARGEVQTLIEEVRRAAGAGAGSSGAGGGGAGKEGGAAGGGAGVGGGARVSHGVAVAGTGRGMWLASMELERALLIEGGRARDGGPSSTTSGTSDSLRTNVYAPLVDSLCAYFSRFGHKPYCSHDALAYLRILPASEAAALLARIEADVGPPPTEGSPPPISERWVSRYSCACEWRLGAGLAAAAGIAAKGEAAQGVGTLTGAVGEAAGAPGMGYESPFLLRRRLAYSWLSTHAAHSTLPPGTDARERRPADVLPLLTAQLFMAAPMTEWYYTPDAGLSIGGGLCGGEALLIGTGQVGRDGAYACASGGSESGAMGRSGEGGSPSARPPPPSPRATHVASALLAAVALRRGLATSPDNRQMALALATALNCLGAPVQALRLFQDCDIQQVQHESLSHLVIPAALELGAATHSLAAAQMRSTRHWQEEGLKELGEATILAMNKGNPAQVLQFAAFDRCIRHGWWRTLSQVLELLATLATPAPSSPSSLSESRHALAAAAPLLDAPLTVSALCRMPDTLDLESFESHWPPTSLNIGTASGTPNPETDASHARAVLTSPSLPDGSPGSVAELTRSPPPFGIATVRALRLAWLPRRQLLLRFLARALGPDTEGRAVHDAEAHLRRACGAPPAGIPQGGETVDQEIPVGEEASWSSLLSAARVTCLLMPCGGDRTGPRPPPSPSEVESALVLWSSVVCSCCVQLQADAIAQTGYTPATQRRLVHLATLEAPLLGLLIARWSELLASPSTLPANAPSSAPAAAPAPNPASAPSAVGLHTPAGRTAVAAAAEAASLCVSSALQALAEALNGKMDTAGGGYSPGPASAARRMAEAGSLLPVALGEKEELGAGEAATAVRWVKDALRESEGVCLAGCREALQAAAARITDAAPKAGAQP